LNEKVYDINLAEESLLSLVLYNPELLPEVAKLLKPEQDFMSPDALKIYAFIFDRFGHHFEADLEDAIDTMFCMRKLILEEKLRKLQETVRIGREAKTKMEQIRDEILRQ